MLDILLRITYSLLVLVTPLVMSSSTSELFEFNKMLFIYVGAAFVLFFWILKMVLRKKIYFKRTILDIPLGLFFFSQIASTIFSIDIHTSLFGYYGRFNGGLISIIAYLILYYGFVSNIKKSFVDKLLKFSLLASFAVILWGIPGHFGHDLSCLLFLGQFNNSCWTDQFRPAERMFSTLGQPNWLGAYLAIHFFIGLYFLYKQFIKKEENNFITKQTVLWISYLFFNFSAVLFTRSRSALASVMVSLIIFFGYAIVKGKILNKSDQKKTVLILGITLLVSLVLFMTGVEKIDRFLRPWTLLPKKESVKTNSQTPSQPKYTVDTGVTDSLSIRSIVWKGAINLGKQYPVFGTGVETFAYAYYFVRPQEHNMTSEWDYLYNKAHNEYLNFLATTGFVGLASYLLMIGSSIFLFYSLYRKNKLTYPLPLFAVLSYLTILITNFFGFSTSTVNLFFFLLPAIAVVAQLDDNKNENTKSSVALWQGFIVTAASGLLIFVLFYIFFYFQADTIYARADLESKTGNYQQAAQLADEALKLHYEHVYEDKLSYLLANLSFIASYQKETDTAQKLLKLSDYYNLKTLKASPKNVLYWKTRAKNEYLFYQVTLDSENLKQGIEALQQAQVLSPTDAKIGYSEGLMYSLYADEQKSSDEKKRLESLAIQQLDTSINLKPNYRDSYFLKGQLLKKNKQISEAKNVFEFILKNIDPNDTETKKELQLL